MRLFLGASDHPTEIHVLVSPSVYMPGIVFMCYLECLSVILFFRGELHLILLKKRCTSCLGSFESSYKFVLFLKHKTPHLSMDNGGRKGLVPVFFLVTTHLVQIKSTLHHS